MKYHPLLVQAALNSNLPLLSGAADRVEAIRATNMYHSEELIWIRALAVEYGQLRNDQIENSTIDSSSPTQ